jgi:uncharacterized protein (TIGR00251 family)
MAMWHDALTETKAGVYLDVRVSPGSGRSGIRGYDQWRKCLLVDIKAEPRQGKANAELLSLFSEVLDLPSSRMSISSGQTTSNKRIFVEGISARQAQKCLGEALGPV